ncbi:MAG: VOC family protein [Caulobacteraceae bacterium]|nr:VOC family protein [Caulobacteraceae bacterium]
MSTQAATTWVNGVHHIGMSVPDIDAARAFFVDLLGLKELRRGPMGGEVLDRITRLTGTSGRILHLAAGNAYLEIFEFKSPAPDPLDPQRPVNNYGYTHLAFDVSDTDAVCERLKKAGIEFHCDVMAVYGVKTVYGRDPFGNVFELQQVVAEEHVKRLPAVVAVEG